MTQTPSQPSAQAITPQLRQWIVDQAESGYTAAVILQSMRDAGWTEDVAILAMESTLTAHLKGKKEEAQLAPGVPVPEPTLPEGGRLIDAGDRQVQVLCSMHKPRLLVLGNVLSDEECEALIAAANPRLNRSLTVAPKTGGEELNADRTSEGMFFSRGESDLITRIEARIARMLNWPLVNGEGLQVLHYGPGAEYKPHYDYFDPGEPGTPTILRRGGQRVATLVMYLNTPERGGDTVFPDVHFNVAPIRGSAVFFSYERAHPTTRTLHGGAPVMAGEKWVATKWMREREFI
ncbi:2OG-Fe(II) oxygenase [Variovorax sp. HJSM1_2]|uniref:2OG-Fe(II) oxygenase n=1 Tax=Variovorax sp. HJSM1_2 TaxID=3366263 RepID=UPI003BBB6400